MHPLDFKKERPAHVTLHVLRNIPLASWRAVLSEKLLQSRLLNCLYAQLVTVADAVCITFYCNRKLMSWGTVISLQSNLRPAFAWPAHAPYHCSWCACTVSFRDTIEELCHGAEPVIEGALH